MGKAKNRVPKGYWQSPEGSRELELVAGKRMPVKDVAARHGISPFAIYKALHYWRKRNPLYALNNSVPLNGHDDSLVQKLIAFAEDIVGPALKSHIDSLRSEISALKAERDEALQKASVAEDALRRAEGENQRLVRQFSDRALQAAGVVHSD